MSRSRDAAGCESMQISHVNALDCVVLSQSMCPMQLCNHPDLVTTLPKDEEGASEVAVAESKALAALLPPDYVAASPADSGAHALSLLDFNATLNLVCPSAAFIMKPVTACGAPSAVSV